MKMRFKQTTQEKLEPLWKSVDQYAVAYNFGRGKTLVQLIAFWH